MRTIIYDKMEPLTPIRDPTVVSNGLSSMKPIIPDGAASEHQKGFKEKGNSDRPSATRAKPEYAFSTVMTTADADPRY
jgi:hypothetical protein